MMLWLYPPCHIYIILYSHVKFPMVSTDHGNATAWLKASQSCAKSCATRQAEAPQRAEQQRKWTYALVNIQKTIEHDHRNS